MISPIAACVLGFSLAGVCRAEPNACALEPTNRDVSAAPRGASGPACPNCVIEMHVYLDNEFTALHAAGGPQVARDVIDRANELLSAPQSMGGLELRLVDTYGTEFAGPHPWASSSNAATLLTNFAGWAQSDQPIPEPGRDIVILLSGIDLDGGVLGLAFQSSICGPEAIGVVSVLDNNTEFNANVLAHQIGHILGAVHDGVSNTCDLTGNIMSPGLSAASIPTTFSDCTIDEVNTRIEAGGDCLAPYPCGVADLAPPIGVLDFSDVTAFLGAFGAMDAPADLAAPFGVFDFSDVSAFLVSFGAGCESL
ncbi:MAG: M12 family metallo-peptidase [Phycisphaerales bacterium JB059]